MRPESLGEFDLIERLAGLVRRVPPDPAVLLGIGDDAAVLDLGGKHAWLATSDLLVEGVHFRTAWCSPRDAGWKAVAVGLSDIAAMGGQPRFALVSLGVPADLVPSWPEEFYRGLGEACQQYAVSVVGGDTCRTPLIIADVAVLGEAEPGRVVTREGARPGDVLVVTGDLGKGAAGLAVLETPPAPTSLHADQARMAAQAFLRPRPRLTVGRALAASGATAMIDLSDGLAQDLGHLLRLSGPGLSARLWRERLPIDPVTAAVARACGVSPLAWALTGGEDYELLAALPAGAVDVALATAPARDSLTVVGEIVRGEGEIFLVDGDGREEVIPPRGFDHFAACRK